jgi:uncharacterized protein YprB with RNaseH-like and TPR domain
MKVASFDIECTALDASYGRMLCACFKFHNEEKVRTTKARWLKDEPKMLTQISKWWDEADVICTWNGKMFDVRYTNARLLTHYLPPLDAKKMHEDVMYEAKKLRLRGARLDGVAKDLKFKHQKIDRPASDWVLAAEGNRPAQTRIVEHCEQDVRMTQEAFERLMPVVVRITR